MRIGITGLGIVCPLGVGRAAVSAMLAQDRSALAEIQGFDSTPYRCRHGGEVRGFDDSQVLRKARPEHAGRCARFAVAAAREALADAGLELERPPAERIALCLGTSHGALSVTEEYYRALLEVDGCPPFDSAMMSRKQYGSIGKALCMELGVRGVQVIMSNACASSLAAIGRGMDLLLTGKADLVLVGGTDTIDQSLHAGFFGLKATAVGPCQPFSQKIGINLGEGSAFFALEPIAAAERRGARVLAELLGYATSNDAHHSTAPDPTGKGAAACFRAALHHARIAAEQVDYVNAHGTGTASNDSAESKVHRVVFGERAPEVPISSTKGHFGHATGAAGALELASVILGLERGVILPTLGFDQARAPELGLDHVPNQSRAQKTSVFVKNSFGFGGFNAVAVFGASNSLCTNDDGGAPERPRRVVITGAAAVTCIATDRHALFDALSSGEFRRENVTHRGQTGATTRPVGSCRELEPRRFDRRIDPRRMDRLSQLATVAAKLCLDDAGHPKPGPNRLAEDLPRAETGAIMAVAMGPREGIDHHLRSLLRDGPLAPSAVHFPYTTQNSALGQVMLHLGLRGPCSNLTVEACGGLAALATAVDWVRLGYGDRILAGAGDELFPTVLHQLEVLGDLAVPEACSPKDADGQGYVPGEGAAFVCVEAAEAARERGARVLAEVVGWGSSSDSNSELPLSEGTGEGLLRAIRVAAEEAGVIPEQIDIVLCSQRGLPEVRSAERRALAAYFQGVPSPPWLTTAHHATGWLEAASVLVDAVLLIEAIQREALPAGPQGNPLAGMAPLRPCREPRSHRTELGLLVGVSREGLSHAVLLRRFEESKVGAES